MSKKIVLIGLVVAGIITAVLTISLPVCYVTTTMPPRDLFEMGPAVSAIGSAACVMTAGLT